MRVPREVCCVRSSGESELLPAAGFTWSSCGKNCGLSGAECLSEAGPDQQVNSQNPFASGPAQSSINMLVQPQLVQLVVLVSPGGLCLFVFVYLNQINQKYGGFYYKIKAPFRS